MPVILVTNDDGVSSAGIHALATALKPLGSVTVVAPTQEASAIGHALTLRRPLRIEDHGPGLFAVDGTPTDCVNLGVDIILKQKPDLVVSGINNGANMGEDTIYSGTVAAAMEGYLFGIPAIAFSLAEKGWAHLDSAGRVARDVIQRVLAKPPGTSPFLLNVNIPNKPYDASQPKRLCRLGRRHASEGVIRQANPRGEPIYWIGPAGNAREAGEGTDFHAVARGEVSITPLQFDLTDHARIAVWQEWLGPAGGQE